MSHTYINKQDFEEDLGVGSYILSYQKKLKVPKSSHFFLGKKGGFKNL